MRVKIPDYEPDIHSSLPDELKQVCLTCEKPHCHPDKCARYREASQAYYRASGKANMSGRKPRKHPYHDEELTAGEYAARVGVSAARVHELLRCGWTLERMDGYFKKQNG